jgi:hypothetical protein
MRNGALILMTGILLTAVCACAEYGPFDAYDADEAGLLPSDVCSAYLDLLTCEGSTPASYDAATCETNMADNCDDDEMRNLIDFYDCWATNLSCGGTPSVAETNAATSACGAAATGISSGCLNAGGGA